MKKITLLLFSIFVSIFSGFTQVNHWETAVFDTDTWRYFVGTSEPSADWRSLTFDETKWLSGKGGFGFGDNDDGTIIPKTNSVYLRIIFNVPDTSKIISTILSVDYDDAFVAYLNDTEIARVGLNGTPPAYNQLGTDHEAALYRGGSPDNFPFDKKRTRALLKPGKNVLAVQVHNSASKSSDLTSNVFLTFGIKDNSVFFRQPPYWFTPPLSYTSSNLPLILIDTDGNKIIDEPKIDAKMKIINHGLGQVNSITDSANVYDGNIGIEIRGHSSAYYPQKPYAIETRDSLGLNNNVSLLGMPAENDWVLLSNYNDKVLMRNTLAFDIFRRMGHYAPRITHTEVFLNNDYQGIYLFGEKIKQDKNRVNISTLTELDIAGVNLTGGYIFKNDYTEGDDKFYSSFSPVNRSGASVYFIYHDPKPDILTLTQKKYLENYVYEAEKVLYSENFKDPINGYRAYFDVNSFIDYIILGEVSRNVDHYKKSRYFYKNKDTKSKLIYSGPVWDYDWAFKNIAETGFNMTDGSGWAYLVNDYNVSPVPPSWEVRMIQDESFANQINSRYFSLRKTILSNEQIFYSIDSVAALLSEAQVRHYQKWKTLGMNVGAPEVDYQPKTFTDEIKKFKDWITVRLQWLDGNMLGNKTPVNEQTIAGLSLYPNPVKNTLYIQSEEDIMTAELIDAAGRTVKLYNNINGSLNLSDLNTGFYLIKITAKNKITATRKIFKE